LSVAPGAWKPQLHFVWTILLDLLLPQDESVSPEGSFQDFWSLVVDGKLCCFSRRTLPRSQKHVIESLFSSTSSPERKYWGFQLFQKALPKIRNPQDLPFLFTKNFMRTWINHLSKSDRYLHKAALSVVCDPYPYLACASANGQTNRPRISTHVCKVTPRWVSR
jgi:DNA polymerase phi